MQWRHYLFGGVLMPYKRSDMRRAIDEYIINPRYRDLLLLRLCEGRTYEEISEIVSYSPQHVKYICRTYKDFLINHL